MSREISYDDVVKILNKKENIKMKKFDITIPEQLVSGVSSAANSRDGKKISYDEFMYILRNGRTNAMPNAQENSLLSISDPDRRVLFKYLQQRHKKTPTIATDSELAAAYAPHYSAVAKAAYTTRYKSTREDSENPPKSRKKTRFSELSPVSDPELGGGSRKKTNRRKSIRRRNKTSRR
jgi:hypothetical protein